MANKKIWEKIRSKPSSLQSGRHANRRMEPAAQSAAPNSHPPHLPSAFPQLAPTWRWYSSSSGPRLHGQSQQTFPEVDRQHQFLPHDWAARSSAPLPAEGVLQWFPAGPTGEVDHSAPDGFQAYHGVPGVPSKINKLDAKWCSWGGDYDSTLPAMLWNCARARVGWAHLLGPRRLPSMMVEAWIMSWLIHQWNPLEPRMAMIFPSMV